MLHLLLMDDITVLVLARPEEPQLTMLQALPESTIIIAGDRIEAFERAAPEVDVILQWSAPKALLRQVWRIAPRVRWVHSRATGVDGLLFPELARSDVPFTNSRGIFSGALGEFVMGAVLFFAKDFRRMVRSQEHGKWDPFNTTEVCTQILGILGYGDIGRAVAQRAQAMGMKVVALRRRPELSKGDPFVQELLPPEGKMQLLRRSDYVVITTPLTPETRGLIGEPELRAMKSTAVLMNIARGPVVDEQALLRVLQEKRIRGAALDVFNEEPLPNGHPFYELDNLLLSPHCADNTTDWKERAMRCFLENFDRFRKGEPLKNLVDKRAGY